jgi:hypothetical protein
VLYLVLILVIVAFVLLIAALTTANTIWAWVSVAISVVAAGLLIFDWLRGRRRVATTSAPRPVEDADDRAEAGESAEFEEPPAPVEVTTELPPVSEPVSAPAVDEVAEPVAVTPPPADDAEPDEEPTDATDRLVIAELSVEVVVVDEHPRYHLTACTWLKGRETIPLPVSEARTLGFTPCARCGPDATIAAKHRASKATKQ